jgi:hypothetical protein
MSDDVRDLAGRLRRVGLAAVIGIVGSLAVTLLLPTRDHFPLPPGSCGFSHIQQGNVVEGGSLSLMIAGAIVIAVAAYSALGFVTWWAANRGAAAGPLPRATARYASRPYL